MKAKRYAKISLLNPGIKAQRIENGDATRNQRVQMHSRQPAWRKTVKNGRWSAWTKKPAGANRRVNFKQKWGALHERFRDLGTELYRARMIAFNAV